VLTESAITESDSREKGDGRGCLPFLYESSFFKGKGCGSRYISHKLRQKQMLPGREMQEK
jgi:hypothetical protein